MSNLNNQVEATGEATEVANEGGGAMHGNLLDLNQFSKLNS